MHFGAFRGTPGAGIADRSWSCWIWATRSGSRSRGPPVRQHARHRPQRRACRAAWGSSGRREIRPLPGRFPCQSRCLPRDCSSCQQCCCSCSQLGVPLFADSTGAWAGRQGSLFSRAGHGSHIPRRFARAEQFLGRGGPLLRPESGLVFLPQLTHVGVAQGDRDAVDATFDASTEIIGLEGVLCAKFAGAFGD